MMQSQQDWSAMVQRVAEAPTEDFAQLLRIAGLDPSRALRFGDFSGVSFRGTDLRGFDFTGSKLHACDFSGALVRGARFDAAELAAVKVAPPSDEPRHHIAGLMGPKKFAPADEMGRTFTPIANLSAAEDWEAHSKSWYRQPPQQQPSDNHLRPGAIFKDAPFAPEMVVVPSGTVTVIRSPKSNLQRHITISRPFAVGRFTVREMEWDAAQEHPEWEKYSQLPRMYVMHLRGMLPRGKEVGRHEATAYVRWLAAVTGRPYRLLSKKEWEYCSRGGSSRSEGRFDARGLFDELLNEHFKNERAERPNAWGLHDLQSIGEWCRGRTNSDILPVHESVGYAVEYAVSSNAALWGRNSLRVARTLAY